jgi:hypothetical protein
VSDTVEEQQKLVNHLKKIAQGFNDGITHSESCWEHHPGCAILLAAESLDGWTQIQCAEHDELFLTPDCPKCVGG